MHPALDDPCKRARARLERLVTQLPLLETAASLRGLANFPGDARAPGAVFVGIGLASRSALSLALPLDVLGMLLAAEHVRRVCGAPRIALLLADSHALSNGLPAGAIATRSQDYERVLTAVLGALGWRHAYLTPAHRLHARDAYRRLHERVMSRAPSGEHPYVTREVTDIEYFARTCGGILKLGWALHPDCAAQHDERSFDQRFAAWMGGHVSFVYCKAGRALDDRRCKVTPYIALDPASRVCLDREEDVAGKLTRAAPRVSRATMCGVRNHLKAIARSYNALVRPLRGPLEVQLRAILDQLLGPATDSSRSGDRTSYTASPRAGVGSQLAMGGS